MNALHLNICYIYANLKKSASRRHVFVQLLNTELNLCSSDVNKFFFLGIFTGCFANLQEKYPECFKSRSFAATTLGLRGFNAAAVRLDIEQQKNK